jgi:hypothetical protein
LRHERVDRVVEVRDQRGDGHHRGRHDASDDQSQCAVFPPQEKEDREHHDYQRLECKCGAEKPARTGEAFIHGEDQGINGQRKGNRILWMPPKDRDVPENYCFSH